MYQEFKRKLLDEMEMKRDMIVLHSSRTSLDSIFEVSSEDDKLYNQILKEFERIAIVHAEDLLYELCEKHGIDVERSIDSESFDLSMTINGEECYIEIKTSPIAVNSGLIANIEKCQEPVYIVYLLKDNQQSRDAILHKNQQMHIEEDNVRIKTMLFEEFILEQFGIDELNLFEKAMLTYKEEMHQAVGYQITEIFNQYNLEKLKQELVTEILEFPYERIKIESYNKIQSDNYSFKDLNETNYSKIKEQFINNERYKLLLGEGDFAKSFLTSEWLYKKYFILPEMDNTFIVAGYLKSIEQLLWDIIYILGQGRPIRGKEKDKEKVIEEDNFDEIDTTLGSLQYFITSYSNDDLFSNVFGTNVHFVMKYLRTQLYEWKEKYRNGYFHKHNLEEKERIDTIKEETIFMYFLILGTISLDENVMIRLGNNYEL